MKIFKMVKKPLVVVLVLMVLIQTLNLSALAVDTGSVASQSIDGFDINIEWGDSEFKDGTSFNLVEKNPTSNTVTMKVNYVNRAVSEEGYAEGDLIITVKGIGSVIRSGVVEAIVGADKSSSSVKLRDWSYTWNRATDTYTFTNNEAIKPNSVFSGYFELVWDLDARSTIEKYSQDGIQAQMILPNGSSIKSESLSFSNDTTTDNFKVDIEQATMYTYEGLTDGIDNPEDYSFVRYNLGAEELLNSRGLAENFYIFNPDVEGAGEGTIVISPKLNCEKVVETNIAGIDVLEGSYKVNLDFDLPMAKQYLFVAYPKDKYTEKNVTATIEMYGSFYEGDDSGNTDIRVLCSDSINLPVPNDFDFVDFPGEIPGDFWKDDYYDKHVAESITEEQGGDIAGSKMINGTTETFYLELMMSNPWGTAFTYELVDDFLYILKNNGDFRQLGIDENGNYVDEYEFERVTIPGSSEIKNMNDVSIKADTYKVEVYAKQEQENDENGIYDVIDPSSMEPVWTGVIKKNSQSVTLPSGTTSVAVFFIDVIESIDLLSVPVDVKFHIRDSSELSWEEQDNLTTGQVINTSFERIYDENEDWITDYWTKDNYLDDTNLGLAEKDKLLYGNGKYYLDREKDNITFFEGYKNDYTAYTNVSDVKTSKNKVIADMSMGADFAFKGDEYPNKFSLYTILPNGYTLNGYTIEEDIYDIMTLSGFGLSEERLFDALTPTIIKDYNGSGRTYIGLTFDFGDKDILQDEEIRAEFKIKGDISYLKKNRNVFVRSNVMMDKAIEEYSSGKKLDDGTWGDDSELFSDIDRDGISDETLSYALDFASFTYADSSLLQLTKYVKTTYSDGWVQIPDVPYEEYGGSYSYKLSMKTGSGDATNIVVTDILESGSESQWKGVLQSVNISQCEDLGMKGIVYYSTKENPDALYDADGNLNVSDWETTYGEGVKAIAVDFGESKLKSGKELEIIINMKAPKDTSLREKITENGFIANFTELGATTGEVTQDVYLESNFVRVKLTPELKSIIVTKKDAEDKSVLSGAEFSLLDKNGDVVSTATSNAKGYAIFHEVLKNETYTLKETKSPIGYKLADDIEITITGGEKKYEVTIEDARKTGTVELYKGNNLDNSFGVAGARYTLYDVNGNEVVSQVTGADGKLTFSDLPWGSYVIKETASPNGYQLNDTEYLVEVNRNTVEDIIKVKTTDIQDDVYMHLTKYVADINGNPTEEKLSGAVFKLIRKLSGEREIEYGLYVTDENGEITITDLPYGEYYFKEYRAPLGYALAEDTEVITLSPENKEGSVKVYDSRKSGTVIVSKQDNLGNMIEGIEFTLYSDENLENSVGTYTTDEYGNIRIDGLEWGKYWLMETYAPEYYQISTEPVEIVIGAESLEVFVNLLNETTKGKVVLTKYNEDESSKLEGAEYSLYRGDGEFVGKYVSDSNGEIIVDGLEWGSYYFKETKAPEYYVLSDETIRFSVNAANAGVTQNLVARDAQEGRSITLTKKINAEDINFDNGDPAFIFRISGIDIEGKEHTYYRIISFSEKYVENNVDGEGFVSQSVTISDLTAGQYSVVEEDSSRYVLGEIIDIVGGAVKESVLVFDMETNEEGSAVFVNDRYENGDFSDTQNVTNVIKKSAKLTAIKAEYGVESVSAGSSVDRSLLEVTAFFDDGDSVVLGNNDYTLSMESFPNVNGEYTVTVSYEYAGIIRTDDFIVSITGGREKIVALDVTVKDEYKTVTTGTPLFSGMFEAVAIYNNGDREILKTDVAKIDETITSPNWPERYPNNMTEEENYWEISRPGAASIKLVFDEDSWTDFWVDIDSGDEWLYDWINVYDRNGDLVKSELGGPLSNYEIIIPGDYAKVTVVSDGGSGTISGEGKFRAYIYALDENGEIVPVEQEEADIILDKNSVPTTDGEFVVTVNLNPDLFEEDVPTTVSMMAEYPEPLLESGLDFNSHYSYGVEKVVFSDIKAPDDENVVKTDVSARKDGSVVSWVEDTIMYVSSQRTGVSIIANKDCSSMFEYVDMKKIDFTYLDTQNVTDMSSMFAGCSDLTELDLSNFNTSKVTTMEGMFSNTGQNASSFKLVGLNNWDTSNVTTMKRMFSFVGENASSWGIEDISNWDTSKVTTMEGMFSGVGYKASSFKLDLSAKIINEGKDNEYIAWNTSNVQNMENMFSQVGYKATTFELNLSGWDLSSATQDSAVSGMFHYAGDSASSLKIDLSGWDTSKVTNMSYMFQSAGYNASSFELVGLNDWDTSKVTSMFQMFYYAGYSANYTLDLSDWKVPLVTSYGNFNGRVESKITPPVWVN